ncbi:hypothetical protein GIB67_030213 [Kingdonia uniflora]|uniref:EF-hand domain-containing protein n=1 Tax=Kingdonia uniflora TaxID=39325 RepID=A0A7J7MN43_9MAGN|nr:hypothetical protein GIB67_030213 [Kingdonia uniflora]
MSISRFSKEHPWLQNAKKTSNVPLEDIVRSRLKQFSAMNRFKKKPMRVIAEHLSAEEVEVTRDMFKLMGYRQDRKITYEELKTGLQKVQIADNVQDDTGSIKVIMFDSQLHMLLDNTTKTTKKLSQKARHKLEMVNKTTTNSKTYEDKEDHNDKEYESTEEKNDNNDSEDGDGEAESENDAEVQYKQV